MTLPYEARLRDENAKLNSQLKTTQGQVVYLGRQTVVKTVTGHTFQNTPYPEAFNIIEAEKVRAKYPNASIMPVRKFILDRIAENEKIIRTFK